jgi:hypothetical protein
LKITRTHRLGARRGLALLWALLLAVALVPLAIAVFGTSRAVVVSERVEHAQTRARFLAQGATAHAADAIRTALMAGAPAPATGVALIDGTAVDYTIVETVAPLAVSRPEGLDAFESVYRIEAIARTEDATHRLRRTMRAQVIPLFQFAFFYEGDMEFVRPAPMVISGPVHCNGDIYIAVSNTGSLRFDTNYLRCAGDIIGRPPASKWGEDDWSWLDTSSNPATIREWVKNPFDVAEPKSFADLDTWKQFNLLGIASTGGFDSNFAGLDLDLDGDYDGLGEAPPWGIGALEKYDEPKSYGAEGNTVLTAAHGQQRLTPPAVEDLSMYVEDDSGDYDFDAASGTFVGVGEGEGSYSIGTFYESAGLRILTDGKGSWTAEDGSGSDVTAKVAAAVSVAKIYDAREAAGAPTGLVPTIEVDMTALAATGLLPKNGLLYMASTDHTSDEVTGFVVKKGASLTGDLTIATPNSVYLQGDFNSDKKHSAAVLADAVNLLSNNWNGSKTKGTLPKASNTTWNVAIMTGNTPSTNDVYSGGPHNLPRFHEAWSGVTATISGSMVCTGPSQRARGGWALGGDYYTAPNRNWSFDTRFNSPSELPPFTPRSIELEDVAMW